MTILIIICIYAYIYIYFFFCRAATRLSMEREVQISGKVKSNTGLPTARHRCSISSKGAVLPWRNDANMGPKTRYTLRRNTASIMKDLT